MAQTPPATTMEVAFQHTLQMALSRTDAYVGHLIQEKTALSSCLVSRYEEEGLVVNLWAVKQLN